jgi:hypothetical protein
MPKPISRQRSQIISWNSDLCKSSLQNAHGTSVGKLSECGKSEQELYVPCATCSKFVRFSDLADKDPETGDAELSRRGGFPEVPMFRVQHIRRSCVARPSPIKAHLKKTLKMTDKVPQFGALCAAWFSMPPRRKRIASIRNRGRLRTFTGLTIRPERVEDGPRSDRQTCAGILDE